MRLIVCGGRGYVNVAHLWQELDAIHGRVGIEMLIEGASDDVTGPYVGADYWAHQWALARGVESVRCHAEWKRLGRSAGPIRNGKMLDEYKPDAVMHTPGGRGTADMVKQAKLAGVQTIELVR